MAIQRLTGLPTVRTCLHHPQPSDTQRLWSLHLKMAIKSSERLSPADMSTRWASKSRKAAVQVKEKNRIVSSNWNQPWRVITPISLQIWRSEVSVLRVHHRAIRMISKCLQPLVAMRRHRTLLPVKLKMKSKISFRKILRPPRSSTCSTSWTTWIKLWSIKNT